LGMGAVIYYLNLAGVNLFATIVIAGLAYGVFILLIKAVPMDLIKSMIRRDS